MKTAEDYIAQAEVCLTESSHVQNREEAMYFVAKAGVRVAQANVAQNAEALAFGREAQQQIVDSLAAVAGEIEEHPRYPRGIVP